MTFAYQPSGPFSDTPAPGFARILQPSRADDVAASMISGDKRARANTETGAPLSRYMPRPQAVQWARELAETFGRPYRVTA